LTVALFSKRPVGFGILEDTDLPVAVGDDMVAAGRCAFIRDRPLGGGGECKKRKSGRKTYRANWNHATIHYLALRNHLEWLDYTILCNEKSTVFHHAAVIGNGRFM
jgi:hypothetical protein